MLGKRQELNLQFLQILDGALLVFAFLSAYAFRYTLTDVLFLERAIPPVDEFRWLLFIIMPFGPILLELQGFYKAPLQKNLLKSWSQMGRAGFWLGLLIGACVVFFKLQVPSRAALVIFLIFAAGFLTVREIALRAHLRRKLKGGKLRENVLLAGRPMDVARFRRSLTQEQLLEIDVVGEVDIEKQPLADLVEALHRHAVSRVVFAGEHSQLTYIQQAIGACETEGVEAWLMADFIKTSIARPDFDSFGGRPMLVFRTTPELSWALLLKSLIDRAGAAVILLLTSPLFLIAAVGVKLTSPGPIIFRQTRAGKNGRPFVMYKFRSMRTDAEMRRSELEAYNEMTGPVFKIGNDPRVTKFGRWLRVTSIDELPQLVNVLQGHMSLVGPRPLPIYEVARFENTAQRRRLSVKPGLTCLWQVSGRSKVNSFQDWVKLDLDYIDNWSIWLDIKILLRTVPAVLFGLGAR